MGRVEEFKFPEGKIHFHGSLQTADGRRQTVE
jgi:hypothetical protein